MAGVGSCAAVCDCFPIRLALLTGCGVWVCIVLGRGVVGRDDRDRDGPCAVLGLDLQEHGDLARSDDAQYLVAEVTY